MDNQSSSIPCTICGDRAKGLGYGVVACEPCKMFFKRNAQNGLNLLECRLNSHCEINVHTRNRCAYCRLVKCFSKGMQRELLRCSHATKSKIYEKRKSSYDKRQIISTISSQSDRSSQISTLNILQADHSTLTLDQWNLLSNLSHCYDDHAGLSIGQTYMSDQYNLPPRCRFKSASIIHLYQRIIEGAQSLYTHNKDFLALCADDRSLLLQNTSGLTACLCMNFIGYKIQLMSYPAYFDALEMICTAKIASIGRRLALRLNFDLVVMKLFLAIASFSTYRLVGYFNDSPKNLTNVKDIQRIQDEYIEITWRYLLYKFDHQQAVKSFSELLRCIFLTNSAVALSEEIRWFHEKVDLISKKTEESLSLHD